MAQERCQCGAKPIHFACLIHALFKYVSNVNFPKKDQNSENIFNQVLTFQRMKDLFDDENLKLKTFLVNFFITIYPWKAGHHFAFNSIIFEMPSHHERAIAALP